MLYAFAVSFWIILSIICWWFIGVLAVTMMQVIYAERKSYDYSVSKYVYGLPRKERVVVMCLGPLFFIAALGMVLYKVLGYIFIHAPIQYGCRFGGAIGDRINQKIAKNSF